MSILTRVCILTALAVFTVNSQANASIHVQLVGPNGADYSALFRMTYVGQQLDGNQKFSAQLLNTSTQNPDALIDRFAFNLNTLAGGLGNSPTIAGDELIISNFAPATWAITDNGSNSIEFDYLGDPDSQADRLGNGASLTFDLEIDATYASGNSFNTNDPYRWFFNSEISDGGGFGGGDDYGQVGVSFQQLNTAEGIGEGSDLVSGNWAGGIGSPPAVPEPTSIICWSLLAVGAIAYRRRRRNN